MPKVSVIIPIFNRAALLKEAVLSVYQQTYPHIEIVIVDDGSTEDQERYLVDLGVPYRLIVQEKNSGVSAARNIGVREARGEYLAFLDSDDLWDKNKIQKQVDRLEARPGVLLGHTDEIWIRNGVRVNPMKKHAKSGGDLFLQCLPLCVISPSSSIMRREIFDKVGMFDETLPACEDYDFWLRVAKDHHVDYLAEPLTIKRGGHPDQLSRKYWGMDRFRVQALSSLLERGGLSGEQGEAALKVLLEKCDILRKGAEKRGDHERGREYAQRAASMKERYFSPK